MSPTAGFGVTFRGAPLARRGGPRTRHLRLINNVFQHFARSASRGTSRLAAVGLLTALLAAPSLLLFPRAAVVVEPLLAAVIVGLAAALWQAGRQPAATQDAEFRALHDSLTGLPNRTLFDDRLGHALAQSSRDGDGAAVMVIDLDRFKDANDAHGHAAGDAVLRATAERLAATLAKRPPRRTRSPGSAATSSASS